MNVTENKNEATETTATATAAKKKLPLWGKILLVVVIVLAALAGLATLYVNGKLDLLHYNDGSVDSMGTIDADEDQDLDHLAHDIIDRIYLKTSRKDPYSIAILNSYLYFKEREIERIITTIEKIRYGLGAS